MNWLKNLTGKDIATIITSVGGIVLAGFLGYAYWTTTSNHIDHSTAAILRQAVSNEKFSNSVDRLTTVIDKKLK